MAEGLGVELTFIVRGAIISFVLFCFFLGGMREWGFSFPLLFFRDWFVGGHDIMIGFVFGFRINQDGIEFRFVIVHSFLSFISFCFLLLWLDGIG